MKHTKDELRQWQALPLSVKVRMTLERIRMWLREYGESGVYVSFSGGKDSTVLSHLVDVASPNNDIPRVFVNTGLEYPEIVQFVKQEERAEIIKPKMNFRQVIEKYGYPFISKEVSTKIMECKKYEKHKSDGSGKYGYAYKQLYGIGDWAKGGKREMFSMERFRFLLDDNAPNVSPKCCNVMKKSPAHSYSHKSGRVCMTAEMAEESRLRTQKWLQNGCNGFHLKEPKSTPMAFWTEQDVLQYIKENGIQIASVYGDIVYDEKKSEQLEGQLEFGYDGITESKCALKTTGCKRTGCMFCGYGCHLDREGEGRFERLKITHPKIYEWIFKDWEQGGLGYKKVIDWINENGNLNIRY